MTTPSTPDPILPTDRAYLEARRQAILIELGAIERRLGLERTRVPRHERERAAWRRRTSEEERYGHE
jgi:hypothetical protein